MPGTQSVSRGSCEIRRLQERVFDLRGLDLDGFRGWLERRLSIWERDPIFCQRQLIRDLRRLHPELGRLEARLRRAEQADAASPSFARLTRLQAELHHTRQAIGGLSVALQQAPPEKRSALQEKLAHFEELNPRLSREQADMSSRCPERRNLLRLQARLDRLRRQTGLDAHEAALREVLRHSGQRSGQSGCSFEQTAQTISQQELLGELQAETVLTGVTLGAARTEFDQLLVRSSGGPSVQVLAAVEVKRNLNDLARGYLHRQENLAWLKGERSRYDEQRYRTHYFRSGHFDRPAQHVQDGRSFRLDSTSFAAVSGLYFITRRGHVWGASGQALARIAFRLACDTRLDLNHPPSLSTFYEWCQSLTTSFETPDLLSQYAENETSARRILVSGK